MVESPVRAKAAKTVQAWIELLANDPEAVSAAQVARTRLRAGREIRSMRRLRLIELQGRLPTRPKLEKLLHLSTQFYNPHKERCDVRVAPRDRSPVPAGADVVVVTERGGERRPAAERWWRQETGQDIEVREGVAWVVEWDKDRGLLDDLVRLQGREHGLLCNPFAQEARTSSNKIPLPWISPAPPASESREEEDR